MSGYRIRCSVCDRRVSLTEQGLLRYHNTEPSLTSPRCSGSNRGPTPAAWMSEGTILDIIRAEERRIKETECRD